MQYSKTGAAIFSISILFLLMLPVKENLKEKQKDNFPLSHYPMFSKKRDKTYEVNYFIGYDKNNNRYKIPYQYISSGGFNQVRRQVNRECKKKSTEKFTKKVAKRIAKLEETPFRDLHKIELVEGEYDLDTYFLTSNKAPIREKVLSATNIERP